MNKSAQAKFGFYFTITIVLLLAFAAAQEQQADQNSPQTGQPTQQQENQPPQEQPTVPPEVPQEPPPLEPATPDLNLPTMPQEPAPQIELPSIKIISPIFGETVSGTGLIIIATEPKEKITSAFFEAGGIKKDLSTENNFSSDFNSQQLADGNYDVKATACIGENCQSETVPITVSNQQNPPQEGPPTVQQDFVFLSGSNIFSALTIFDSNNGIAASGTENVQVLAGTYNVQIDFPQSLASKITLANAAINSDMNVTEIKAILDLNSISVPDKNFEWLDFTTIKTNAPFDSGQISFSPTGKQDALFSCSDWDFAGNKCSKEFEKFLGASQSTIEEPLPSQNAAFGFARQLQIEIVPDINSDAFDSNSLKVKQKKSGKRLLKLSKEKINFSANDKPTIDIEITDENGSRTDSDFNAFLVFPDGSQEQIGPENIEWLGGGQYRIKAKMPRSFKAGTYQIKAAIPSENGPVEETQSFEWGLLAVNTRKSIYRPGETIGFEIVVLDRESFGVPAAEVTLAIKTPSGSQEVLSTLNGTITETNTNGIYIASTTAKEEGVQRVFVKATATGIDTLVETTFEVRQIFDFDIERTTPTKIDPANQPTTVQLKITPLDGSKKADIREFVPKEFEITPKKMVAIKNNESDDPEIKLLDAPGAMVFETEDEKIIEWKNVKFDESNAAELEYSYIVPDKKPWLYNIGPIEISTGKNEAFFEARSWMIAVDANPAQRFFFRSYADFNATEPMPNASASGDTFASNTWGSFGMNDAAPTTAQTGTSRANSSLNTGALVNVAVASFISPPLVPQTISAGTWVAAGFFKESATNDDLNMRVAIYGWADSNDNRSVMVVSPTTMDIEFGTSTALRMGSASGITITFQRRDKLVTEIEYYGISPQSAVGTFWWGGMDSLELLRDSNVLAPSNIRMAGDLNTGIVSPANNSSYYTSTAFDVNALGSCRNYSCGDTNVALKYCVNPSAGCSTFYDMNTVSSSPLYVSTGIASRHDNLLGASDTNYFVLTVTATLANTYTIRSSIDSNWSADINTSRLTKADLNVTINLAQPLGFAVSLPSSGCTDGKGRFSGQGSGACQRGYFETTDLSGPADQNKVDAEGQTSTIPFFIYDNQSTASSDINFTLDLNAALPSALALKVSKTYTGWSGAGSCQDIDANCVDVTTASKNIGKATYTGGTQDFNIWVFGDFIGAGTGSTDRNVTHTSVTT
ncbi:MAG: hypothetical protein AABW85_01755 [archaeon]